MPLQEQGARHGHAYGGGGEVRPALAAAALCAALAAHAQPPVDAGALERRLAAVETLIERSSAARQIESSAVPAALEKRESARASQRRAADAFRAGDLARASLLLPEASVQMFEAVKLAAPEQVTAAKRRSDFDARLESVRSLLAAQKRIGDEKAVASAVETTRAIERMVRQAEVEAGAGRLAEASGSVEQAYLIAKAAIGSMRSGDTLVRSLTFATREEEYGYELDRNETHRMLLSVLLDASKAERARTTVERAAALRAQAEASAKSGDAEGAIRLLEDSTRELVRAIRAAGVYIPG